MTDNNTSPVETEINEHKDNVNEYAKGVKELTVPASMQGVLDRYLRDCTTFVEDLEKQSQPSASDLCDFQDRCNALEVQFTKLIEDFQ